MSADLHIHVFAEGELTEKHFRIFFGNVMGSKYWDPMGIPAAGRTTPEHRAIVDKVMSTPNVWIGEVSWLKATVFDDQEKYVPGPVMQVSKIIGEDKPVIDDKLIEKITDALNASNQTSYMTAEGDTVISWLKMHKGMRAFTISW